MHVADSLATLRGPCAKVNLQYVALLPLLDGIAPAPVVVTEITHSAVPASASSQFAGPQPCGATTPRSNRARSPALTDGNWNGSGRCLGSQENILPTVAITLSKSGKASFQPSELFTKQRGSHRNEREPSFRRRHKRSKRSPAKHQNTFSFIPCTLNTVNEANPATLSSPNTHPSFLRIKVH